MKPRGNKTFPCSIQLSMNSKLLINIKTDRMNGISRFCLSMLDHPITVVLNVSDTLKNNGLKVYKFMSIQTQEEHIGHIKQSKSDRFQDR